MYGVHAGVTYYSTQNQIRPHVPVMSKRPKTVLPLVEPPEKKDPRQVTMVMKASSADMEQSLQSQDVKDEEPLMESKGTIDPLSSQTTESQLSSQLESMKLQAVER